MMYPYDAWRMSRQISRPIRLQCTWYQVSYDVAVHIHSMPVELNKSIRLPNFTLKCRVCRKYRAHSPSGKVPPLPELEVTPSVRG